MEVRLALFAGVIPGFVTLVLLTWIWRRAARRQVEGPITGGLWAVPLIVGGAFLAGDWVVNGRPQFWPDSNNYRYVHAIGLIALLGVLDALVRLPAWALFIARACTLSGVGLMLTEGYAPQSIEWHDLAGWLALLGVGGAGVLGFADRGARELPAYATAGTLAAGGVVALPALFLIGSAYGAQVGAAFVAVATAAGVAGLIVRRATLPRGTVTMIGGGLLALLIGAGVQWEVASVPATVLLGLTPLALGAAGVIARGRGLAGLLLGVSLALLIAGGSAGLSYWADPPGEDDGGSAADYGY
ncbi:MAG: hypothetical protein AAF995_09045 [Planctomycetota bacterium]